MTEDQQKAMQEIANAIDAISQGDWDSAKTACWRAGDACERDVKKRKAS